MIKHFPKNIYDRHEPTALTGQTSQESFEYVEIKYRKENEKSFTCTTPINDNEITLYNLASNAVYIILGIFVKDDGDGIKMFRRVCKTNPSHLTKILQESTLIQA